MKENNFSENTSSEAGQGFLGKCFPGKTDPYTNGGGIIAEK
jgi:hypothetical protein